MVIKASIGKQKGAAIGENLIRKTSNFYKLTSKMMQSSKKNQIK